MYTEEGKTDFVLIFLSFFACDASMYIQETKVSGKKEKMNLPHYIQDAMNDTWLFTF